MTNKPNLIYIFADQLRFTSLGFNGDGFAKTKVLDSFAGECTLVDNACSGHPLCAPYRASLLTGKYSTSTGMVIDELRINPRHRTIAHALNDSGYATAYIGKWNLYAAKLGNHYDVKNSYIPKGENRLGFDDYFAAYNCHHEYYAPKAYFHLDSPAKMYAKGYEPDHQTELAADKIQEYAENKKPFALFLSYGTPHDPWFSHNVPAEYYELFKDTVFPLPENYSKKNDPHADLWSRLLLQEREKLNLWLQCYYAMTANLDMNIGRLLETVKNAGIENDTIFVFTSDHGEMFGAHGRRAKNIFYDEAVRVPFLIKWGDKLKKGRSVQCLNTVDIMPTLLSLMGIEIPESVQGCDVSEALRTGNITPNPCLMMGTGPAAIWGNGREWRALRNESYTYATYLSDSSEYLFDNIADPYQMNNLIEADAYSEIKADMKKQMYEKMAQIGDDFEKNSFYKKNWADKRCIRETLYRRNQIK